MYITQPGGTGSELKPPWPPFGLEAGSRPMPRRTQTNRLAIRKASFSEQLLFTVTESVVIDVQQLGGFAFIAFG